MAGTGPTVQGYGCQRSWGAQHTVYQTAGLTPQKEPHWSGTIGALPEPHRPPYPLHRGLSFNLQDCLGHIRSNEAGKVSLTMCIRAICKIHHYSCTTMLPGTVISPRWVVSRHVRLYAGRGRRQVTSSDSNKQSVKAEGDGITRLS